MTHHTPSQSSCKELHTLLEARGEVMETKFVWFNNTGMRGDTFWTLGFKEELDDNGVILYPERSHPAPIATEILERLPEVLVHEKCKLYTLQMRKGWSNESERGKYIGSYWFLGEDYLVEKTAPTLAQAVTDMYIHLIKEELI